MKKDEVYHIGAKDVILVKYITNALENRTDQDDYGTIKTRFRELRYFAHTLFMFISRDSVISSELKSKDGNVRFKQHLLNPY